MTLEMIFGLFCRTDFQIQQTIRAEFSHCTIIIIAHRLQTVEGCDKVLILEKGFIKVLLTIINTNDNHFQVLKIQVLNSRNTIALMCYRALLSDKFENLLQ